MKNSKFLSVLLGVGMNLILSLTLHSTAVAQTFSPPVNVSNTAGVSTFPSIAVDLSGQLNVVWGDNSTGNFEVLFSRSTNGGVSFSAPVNISNDGGDSFAPAIAVDSVGNLYVVWTDNTPGNFEILFSRSTDGGSSFSPPVNISNDSNTSLFPAVAVDGVGNLNVVWTDASISEIFFTRSTDGGTTFSTPKNMSNTPGTSTGIPAIAVDAPGSIYVAWTDSTPGNLEILFSRSTDGGTSFSIPLNISNSPGVSFEPAIAVGSGGNIKVVWDDGTLGSPPFRDILFSHSINGGISFSAPVNISNNAGDSAFATIAEDGAGGLNVVWSDITPGNVEILFSRSTDGGTTFSLPINISNSAGASASPAIFADTLGNINVVWIDDTLGNFEILFSRESLVPAVMNVAVDIKPGSFPNSINLRSRGTIPVAILSSSTFNAPARVNKPSLTFGRTGDERSLAFCNPSPEDVNFDGFLDQVCHFNTQQTGFQAGDTKGVLKGSTVDGTPITGTDSVRIVP